MKKENYYFIVLMLFIYASCSCIFAQNGSIGVAVNGIPDDWQNDLWLNTHYQELAVGDTYELVARRVPEIIDDPFSNNVTLPPFHFEVIRGESVSVETEENKGKITAKKLGTSIIKVSYDAISANGKTYGAVSPVNITYMIVDVIDKNLDVGINLSTDIAIRSYDTFYFTENSVKYAFKVMAEGAESVSVKCNDVKAKEIDHNYIVNLQNRANIIEVIASNSQGDKKIYYVIDARKIEINIDNKTNPGKNFEAGDKAYVSFKGITLPVYKLATIYNPQMENPKWNATGAKVHYKNTEIGEVKTNVNVTQYNLATSNTIEFTLPEENNYIFNDGCIYEYWWGSALGTEKDMEGPGEPNFNAGVMDDRFSIFPNFYISAGYQPATFEDIEVGVLGYRYADATMLPEEEEVNEYLNSGSFAFKNNSKNWGMYTSWYGVAVSNQTDATTPGGLTNQFNSAAGGDVSGSGNYGVIFDANSGGFFLGQEAAITFSNKDYPEGKLIQGCYITNNTYATTSMMNGDSFAKKFGGPSGNDKDFFKLTATGYDAAGKAVGSKDFYLADYRFDDNIKDYIVKDWRWFDLSTFGKVSKIEFQMTSSDKNNYKQMNTPAYFCIDNINKPRLLLQNKIADIEVEKGSNDVVIDLSKVFVDAENNTITRNTLTNEIQKSIAYNTNSDLVTASVSGNNLTLSFTPNKTGEAEIKVKGALEKMGAYSAFMVKVKDATNIHEIQKSKVLITPNPMKNFFMLNASGNVSIYTSGGVKVYENANYTEGNQIDISAMSKGIYIVKINNQIIKLIKQ